MSFDNKDYPQRKDHRRRYYGPRRVDATCRSHGGCPWCGSTRRHKHKHREPIADELLDWLERNWRQNTQRTKFLTTDGSSDFL